MGEYVPKDWRDRIVVDPDTEDLERKEEALFLSAKAGSLFEPDMTDKEWKRFCKAARLEEEERRAKIPRKDSQLTKKQRELLKKGSTSIKSEGVKKVIAERDELIRRTRPQCVDPDDSEFEKDLLEDLGLTEEEFKSVNKGLGQISEEEWQELEKLNQPEEI